MNQPTEANAEHSPRKGNLLLTILGWVVGLPNIIFGLIALAGMPAAGFWMIVFGLLVFPPVHTFTERKFGSQLPWGARAIGAFLALVAFVNAVPATPPRASTEPISAPAVAPATNAPASAAEPAAADGRIVGDSFRLGDFTYRITGVATGETLGNQVFNEVAGPNATFVVIRYEITNEGDKTHTGLADDFELLDTRGRTFRTSSRGATAFLMAGGNNDFLLTELQPGITKPSVQVFEVPVASLDGMRLRVPEKGFFGSDEVIVDLTRKR